MRKSHLFESPKSPDFTLGGLRYFTDYVRARNAKPETEDQQTKNKPLTMKAFATGRDGNGGDEKFKLQLSKIEAEVGHNLISRKGTKLDSEVTLHGEIWAEFGELVLSLYAAVWNATNTPPSSGEYGSSSLSAVRNLPPTDPETGHVGMLYWLIRQNAAISDAQLVADQNGVALHEALQLIARHERPESPHPSDFEDVPEDDYDMPPD